MAGYIVMELEITDPEGFKEYLKLAGPSVKSYAGKVLVGGAASQTLEGNWHPRQLSVGEFESIEQALRWYNSPEYAPAKALRMKVANCQVIAVEGISRPVAEAGASAALGSIGERRNG